MKTPHLHLVVVVWLLLPQPATAQSDGIIDFINAILEFLCLLPVFDGLCDDCNPNPCLNDGVCTDEVGGYTCACNDGFGGDTCDVALDCNVEVAIECSIDGSPCSTVELPSEEQECIKTLCYNVMITDTGEVCTGTITADMDIAITGLPFDFGFHAEFPIIPLCPGDAAPMLTCATVNICGGGTFSTDAAVLGNASNGQICQGQDQHQFSLPPPPAE